MPGPISHIDARCDVSAVMSLLCGAIHAGIIASVVARTFGQAISSSLARCDLPAGLLSYTDVVVAAHARTPASNARTEARLTLYPASYV